MNKSTTINRSSNNILQQLKADCSKCFGLCCTALCFSKIDGFPNDKTDGKPCINLQKDYRCKIHSQLAKQKMKGCIGYDCFGAGQQVTQCIYQGQTWQDFQRPTEIFDVFVIIVSLYQMRYYLAEALSVSLDNKLENDIRELIAENEKMCSDTPKKILALDVEEYQDRVNALLKQACKSFRVGLGFDKKKQPASFFGKDFEGMNLSGFDFTTQLLIAANFDSCTFDGAIFLGADTRDTNFSNADLSNTIFLTQGQVNSAKGNSKTKLPVHLDYPITWKSK